MEGKMLAKFDYYIDESDPDIVVLRRQDGSFVAAFGAQGATASFTTTVLLSLRLREEVSEMPRVFYCKSCKYEFEGQLFGGSRCPSCGDWGSYSHFAFRQAPGYPVTGRPPGTGEYLRTC